VIPDNRSIKVLSNGISHGLNTSIPLGGHIAPISIVGDRLALKYAQKNAKKNMTSVDMNNIIPYFNPVCTTVV
jgi:hypothetical protein